MTPATFPRLLPLGDGAVIVQFGDEVDAATHARVLGFVQALAAARAVGRLPGVGEWVPAFASVTVIGDDATETDAAARDAELLAIARQVVPAQASGRRWCLPACFDAELAPDLAELAAARGLAAAEVVDLVVATPLRVYMLGFMPGFPYMGDLPAVLDSPRRASPRARVPERSIAVAGRMAAVYPWASPGGWHLIGRTPARLFDPAAPEPALLQAGDRVRWQPVDRAAFAALEHDVAAGRIDPASWCEER